MAAKRKKIPDRLYRALWGNRLRQAITLLTGVAVVAAAIIQGPAAVDRVTRCADGVWDADGPWPFSPENEECVGVNGSGYDFGVPEIRQVAGAIAEENARVAGSGTLYVTVAMMLPMQPRSAVQRSELRSELQGAYLAQYRVNRMRKSPLLRLVLANPGADYRHQEPVVDRLKELADSPRDNLRAVTGFNLSLEHTTSAIKRLTNELRIPVLAARVSADEIANLERGDPRFPGLARVIPTNRQQAAALAAFHRNLTDQDTVLVRDERKGDIYNHSLAAAFSRDEPGPPGPKDQVFESSGINEPGDTANDFSLISHNICQSGATTVYFAGRPLHLRLFALELAALKCKDKRFTIVSGSGAATLDRYMAPDDWRALTGEDAKNPLVTVEYAAPGHPGAWDPAEVGRARPEERANKAHQAMVREVRAELKALEGAAADNAERIGQVEFDDSRAMLVHDGVRTIAEAVFLASSFREGAEPTVPTRERIAAQWPRLESAHRVAASSGWVCLTNAGNPYDKPVAVVELDPGSQRVRFKGLGWPEGVPQPADCVVPSGTG